jgi:predicted nucleic acid-binding protein
VGAIDQYLDASFLVALLFSEPRSSRADAFARVHTAELVVSDFATAEFASAVARRVRTGDTTLADGRLVLSAFDRWSLTAANSIDVTSADIALAAVFLRRPDLTLRTPDAIHIAVAQRLNAVLVTFDRRMAATAGVLGVTAIEP